MEWINCKDQLPDSRKSVLVYNAFTEFVEIASYLEDQRRWMCWGDEDKEFQQRAAQFGRPIVTHWMPLPEGPKVG